MSFELSFEKLIGYDVGKPGISVIIELSLRDSSSIFGAKIDTGSTYCVFERRHGEQLGLDVEAGEVQIISTATGPFSAFGHWLTLTVENFTFDVMVFFAKEESYRRNILGRNGWLDRVIIGINDYDGKLYLSRYESE
jgi:hypothetical protein